MDRIDALRIFARVAECGSFTRAADQLGLPRSTVSTVVQALEARVGARLLHRTTRRVSLTPDGADFHDRSLRLIAEFEEMEGLFRTAAARPRGLLRVNVPGRLGRLVIAPALPDFFARYPDIRLDLGVTDRPVDLVEDGVDAVVRVGALADSSLIARRLGDLALINCASPAYLARHGVPATPDNLAGHEEVAYASPLNGRVEPWEYMAGGSLHMAPLPSRIAVNNAESYIACCLAGLGLIQIPAYDVREHLAAGDLVEVMQAFRAPPMPIAVLYPHRRHMSRRLQVFIDWLEPLFRARLELQ